MNGPDIINGILFELGGAASIWLHVWQILKDKRSAGVSKLAVLFFNGWGIWNLYYYPHLHQWWSFAGGLFIVVGNSGWLSLMWKYRRNK